MNVNYNQTSLTNDIALVHLETPILYSTSVQPIKLTGVNDKHLEGKPCTLTGWGATRVTSNSFRNFLILYN